MAPACRVLLVGGGHSHVEVLRRFARVPEAAVALTLVSPEPDTAYSGMLPGLVAGLYSRREAHIALAAARRAGRARHFSPTVSSGSISRRAPRIWPPSASLAFDLLSLDVGSVPEAARARRARARPRGEACRALPRGVGRAARAGRRAARCAASSSWAAAPAASSCSSPCRSPRGGARGRAPAFTLCSDQRDILMQHPAVVRARFAATLAQRGVDVRLGSAVAEVTAGGVRLASGETVAADRVVWTTAAAAPPWTAASGLACDARGFVLVDDHLRSPSHRVRVRGRRLRHPGRPSAPQGRRVRGAAGAAARGQPAACRARSGRSRASSRRRRRSRSSPPAAAMRSPRAVPSWPRGTGCGAGRIGSTAGSWQSTRWRAPPDRRPQESFP